MLTCRNLHRAVLTSGLLLLIAWVVEALIGGGLLPREVMVYAGFILLFAAVGVLILTFLLSLLPFNAKRLGGCEH